MRLCLHDLGFDNLLAATNGREALDLYSRSEGEVALIISDLNMPGMRGDELFWELKRLEYSVRFLLCTGMVSGFDLQPLRKAGLRGFLPKPFTVDQFWAAVANAMM
ncbi:response regulator [Candidatus Peregrinibacteria bacterium]|nr:response regulator [Candidatus Peregrinibacteria bacterium]